jgi:hypothetical protein
MAHDISLYWSDHLRRGIEELYFSATFEYGRTNNASKKQNQPSCKMFDREEGDVEVQQWVQQPAQTFEKNDQQVEKLDWLPKRNEGLQQMSTNRLDRIRLSALLFYCCLRGSILSSISFPIFHHFR